MATEKLVCNFIGEFKVGDNIVRNAKSLCKLVSNNETEIFNKLIVVQTGSIVEAALDQIFWRATNHTKEGVPNISKEDREEIAGKKIGRFKVIIEKMQQYKLLDSLGTDIYKDIELLRQYRNRVHIQFDDEPANTSRDEDKAFSTTTVSWALKLNIRVLKHLIERFPRPAELGQYAHDVDLPNE